MTNDPFVADPFGPVANLGRRLREIFGEAYGELDERMLELLHELDFIPSVRRDGGAPLPVPEPGCRRGEAA